MKKRVQVLKGVYCNSQGQHFIAFIIRDGETSKRISKHYISSFGMSSENDHLMTKKRIPMYLRQQVSEQLKTIELDVYEIDATGNERRKDYRYHMPEVLDHLKQWLITWIVEQ